MEQMDALFRLAFERLRFDMELEGKQLKHDYRTSKGRPKSFLVDDGTYVVVKIRTEAVKSIKLSEHEEQYQGYIESMTDAGCNKLRFLAVMQDQADVYAWYGDTDSFRSLMKEGATSIQVYPNREISDYVNAGIIYFPMSKINKLCP